MSEWIKLTDCETGRPISVRASSIKAFEANVEDKNGSCLYLTDQVIAVRETYDEIRRLLGITNP